MTEIHRDFDPREFWDLTAERFGHDPLAVVIAPTGTKIVNRIRDFFQEISLAPFLASLQGKLVLEIGCGTGRWLTRAEDHGVKIIGLDLSSAMLSLAKVRLLPRKFMLINADLSHIPLRPRVLDCVLSVTALQHVIDQNQLVSAISEFGRTLRPDGAVILLESASDQQKGERVTEDYVTVIRSLESWKRLFEEQEFSLTEVRPVNPSLGAKPLDILRGSVLKHSRFYSNQLKGELVGIRRLLKILWDMTSSVLAVLSFPFDFLLREKLPSLSLHKVMVFRVKQAKTW